MYVPRLSAPFCHALSQNFSPSLIPTSFAHVRSKMVFGLRFSLLLGTVLVDVPPIERHLGSSTTAWRHKCSRFCTPTLCHVVPYTLAVFIVLIVIQQLRGFVFFGLPLATSTHQKHVWLLQILSVRGSLRVAATPD